MTAMGEMFSGLLKQNNTDLKKELVDEFDVRMSKRVDEQVAKAMAIFAEQQGEVSKQQQETLANMDKSMQSVISQVNQLTEDMNSLKVDDNGA